MPQNVPEELSRAIETLYRSESGRILATLVRLLGDIDVAEEAMHEAFAAALDTWPQAGVPDKPLTRMRKSRTTAFVSSLSAAILLCRRKDS